MEITNNNTNANAGQVVGDVVAGAVNGVANIFAGMFDGLAKTGKEFGEAISNTTKNLGKAITQATTKTEKTYEDFYKNMPIEELQNVANNKQIEVANLQLECKVIGRLFQDKLNKLGGRSVTPAKVDVPTVDVPKAE